MSRSEVGSLGRRLSGWLALQSLAGLAVVCGAIYAATALGFRERQDDALAQKEELVRHLWSEATDGRDDTMLRHKLDDFLIGQQDLSLQLLRPDGTVFYKNILQPAEDGDQRELRFAMQASNAGAGGLEANLTLDTSDDRRLLRRLALTLLASALVGSALISAGAHALVRRGLRPVHDLVEQTRRMAADTLDRRLDGSSQPEELDPLVEQFNELLVRLSRAYEQLEGFNADVAHELCTPLANLISSTELALRKARDADELREVLGSNLEDLQRIAGIVQDMLFLSQADRGALARREKVDSLAAVAARVVDLHDAALTDAGLGYEIVGDAQGEFDVSLLQRALSNLLSNATRYATRGTVVRVQIEPGNGPINLMVVNQGEPVGAQHLPRLFDRFYRGDASRTDAAGHHGLGLAIVAAIARMHGGRPLAVSDDRATSIGLTIWPTEWPAAPA